MKKKSHQHITSLGKWQSIQSSNLSRIRQVAGQKLQIEFKSGVTYEYDEVPDEEYEGLIQAESHGKYFDNHIRSVYNYRRLNKRRTR